MDDTKLWLIGALALVIVVAALIWVLRQRGGADTSVSPHDYGAPEVTVTGQSGASGLTFGGSAADDAVLDQTVPLSRLGGAGWRDGSGVPPQQATDGYAGESRSWGDDESAVVPEQAYEHHVEVDNTGPRPPLDEGDRERGGHW
ncbi:acyl-CoA synthase [Janibacter sp. HTCC2649]|uniref:hypothetical protein n=1 Tax=Janibacter sp. HTCC2649 TaxID=313589 RepID=UPI0000670B37|nr:hypothetical protein [Janibacter sp. HTCC2649]EAQ00659.1 acyl-CoA synthase [Janibacter sp. HTCC2649]